MSIVFLSDSPEWCQPLADVLRDNFGVSAVILDTAAVLPTFEPSLASGSLSMFLGRECKVLVNRMSSRPKGDTAALTTLFRSIMDSMSLYTMGQKPPLVINGHHCHRIGASKVMQASLLAAVGARTPRTVVVTRLSLQSTLLRLLQESSTSGEELIDWLLKPNVGGKGVGIRAVGPGCVLPKMDDLADTFDPDGVAVLQQVVSTADGMVHRVELVNFKPLYTAHVSITPESNFNSCLSDVCTRTKKSRILVDAPVFSEENSKSILAMCSIIAEACQMQLGSVEYLIDKEGHPWFIDINPVSTVLQDAEAVLGEGALTLQARWLASILS